MHRDTTPTAELVACGEEAFACIAFANKLVVLVAELVPEVVEGFVVGSEDDVAEPEKRLLVM